MAVFVSFCALVGLPDLQEVDLDSPNFTRRAFETLGKLKALRHLGAAKAISRDFDLSEFPELRGISLEGTTFDDDFVSALAENCPLLEKVSLRRSSITNDGVDSLASLQHLKELTLESSPIDDGIAESIRGMPNLEWLDLHDCPVGDSTLAAAAECPRLKYLHLGQTGITDQGLEVVGKLRNLLYLRLWPNMQLTDQCVPHLSQLPNYPQEYRLHIRLEGTRLSREGIRKLQAALPNANITTSFSE